MTTDEIKEQFSMTDVVIQHGFTPDRSSFIQCPFHSGDRTASLKIYSDSFHCFACGANGDIFKFVQLLDDCDFKTAYLKLGGTYKKKKSFSDLRKLQKSKQRVIERQKHAEHSENRLIFVNNMIDIINRDLRRAEIGSYDWHRLLDSREQFLYEHGILLKEVTKR